MSGYGTIIENLKAMRFSAMAKEYEIVKDEAGFLVSKKKKYM